MVDQFGNMHNSAGGPGINQAAFGERGMAEDLTNRRLGKKPHKPKTPWWRRLFSRRTA
ncbi:MAG: hypothetical protein ACXVQU_06365 [Actinomycetota bacterium]